MLRVGLTGDLGSGKSTVAGMLAARGAVVLSSDEMARALMEPGEDAYKEIVAAFGSEVVAADGSLDRARLAQLAFGPTAPRVEELNAILHPRVLAEQAKVAAGFAGTNTIVVVESALIFSAYGQTAEQRRERFDRILLVIASESEKISRYVARVAGGRVLSQEERLAVEADARRRLALQRTETHAAECRVIRNDAGVAELEREVDAAWHELLAMAEGPPPPPM